MPCAARRERQDAEARAVAAEAQMKQEVAAAHEATTAAKRQAKHDVEKATAVSENKMKDYVDKFREQVQWHCMQLWPTRLQTCTD